KPPTSIAWENGPTGGGSSGDVIAVLLMETTISLKDDFASHLDAENFPDLIAVDSRLVLTRAAANYLFGHGFEGVGLVADVPGISRHILERNLQIHIGLIR